MSQRYLSSSGSTGGASVLERVLGRMVGLLAWAMLAAIGLVFMLSLAIWLVLMVAVSLISSVFTGRPAMVAVLWRRYRELARQRWPQRPGSSTPRADAASSTGAARPTGVEDVVWRDVAEPVRRPPSRED